MTFSSLQKNIYIASLITVALLVGMHIGTAIKGYQYFSDIVKPQIQKNPEREITFRTYEARLVLGITAAVITFFTNFAAAFLIGTTRHVRTLVNLLVFNLTIEVGMGLITAMSIFEMWVTRDVTIKNIPYPNPEDIAKKIWDQNGFNVFWLLLVSDGILIFVPGIVALIYVYIGVSRQAIRGNSLLTDSASYNKM